MKGKYHVLELGSKGAEETIQKFCQTNGQMLLPVVDLITEARLAVDEVIDRAGRGLIETILSMSAEQIAGPKSPGKASGEVRWHGRQLGRVKLADRQLRVERPRLRRKGGGEEAVPAYEALRKSEKTGEEMFEALLKGVSTRNYREVIPEMANSAGVSKSQVSREAAEQGARRLEELLARRWEEVEILVIYLDGMRFGSHHVISAVGVDIEGRKHVLGIQLGATENAAAVKDLLTRLRQQGLRTDQRYLFVIDGAKALRAGIEEVFGSNQLVQRCRTHKLRNVAERLPKGDKMLANQVRSLMRAAWRLPQAFWQVIVVDRAHKKARWDDRVRSSGSSRQLARRVGGDLYDQSSRRSSQPPPLPGNHEPHREPAVGRAEKDWQCLPLARRRDDVALGGRSVSADREEFPEDHGLSRSLGFGIDSRPKSKRCFLSQGESGVI